MPHSACQRAAEVLRPNPLPLRANPHARPIQRGTRPSALTLRDPERALNPSRFPTSEATAPRPKLARCARETIVRARSRTRLALSGNARNHERRSVRESGPRASADAHASASGEVSEVLGCRIRGTSGVIARRHGTGRRHFRPQAWVSPPFRCQSRAANGYSVRERVARGTAWMLGGAWRATGRHNPAPGGAGRAASRPAEYARCARLAPLDRVEELTTAADGGPPPEPDHHHRLPPVTMPDSRPDAVPLLRCTRYAPRRPGRSGDRPKGDHPERRQMPEQTQSRLGPPRSGYDAPASASGPAPRSPDRARVSPPTAAEVRA